MARSRSTISTAEGRLRGMVARQSRSRSRTAAGHSSGTLLTGGGWQAGGQAGGRVGGWVDGWKCREK
jgi:hypothetical protein